MLFSFLLALASTFCTCCFQLSLLLLRDTSAGFRTGGEYFQCKIHTKIMLMHQMRISTIYAQAEKFGNPKGYDCKDPKNSNNGAKLIEG
jgi:hypothetical protein